MSAAAADPHHGLPDPECASMLRRLAGGPSQSIIWAYHHGAWPTDYLLAWRHGASILPPERGLILERIRRECGDTVAHVTAYRRWPHQAGPAMTEAAEALERH